MWKANAKSELSKSTREWKLKNNKNGPCSYNGWYNRKIAFAWLLDKVLCKKQEETTIKNILCYKEWNRADRSKSLDYGWNIILVNELRIWRASKGIVKVIIIKYKEWFRKDRSGSKSRVGSSKSNNSGSSQANPFLINYDLFKSKEDAVEKLI